MEERRKPTYPAKTPDDELLVHSTLYAAGQKIRMSFFCKQYVMHDTPAFDAFN